VIKIIILIIISFLLSFPCIAIDSSVKNNRNTLHMTNFTFAQTIPLLDKEDLEKYSKPTTREKDPALKDNIKNYKQAIPLDTDNLKYFSYFRTIKNRINRYKTYPEEARETFLEGESEVQFTVLQNGQLEDVKIVNSSGFEIFDQNAIQTIKKAAPFDSFPKRIEASKLVIVAKIKYDPSLIDPEGVSLGIPLKKLK